VSVDRSALAPANRRAALTTGTAFCRSTHHCADEPSVNLKRATLLLPAPIAYLKTPFGQIEPTRTAKAMNNSDRACIAAGSSADIAFPFHQWMIVLRCMLDETCPVRCETPIATKTASP
jgi:hypothetical protein